MADALLETYIRQLLEAQPGPEVQIAWQGGEPTLMGLDFFRRSVELAEGWKRPGQDVSYTIRPTVPRSMPRGRRSSGSTAF